MSRGGRRSGTPGSNYGNRTDLALGPRKLPVTTAPGQTYGEAGAQRQAQQAVPMANGPLNSPAPAAAPMTHGDVMSAAQGFTAPPVVPLGMQTLRPAEHVMTGVAPQPAPLPQSPVLKGVALLNALGDSASPEVKALRNVLAASQGNEMAP